MIHFESASLRFYNGKVSFAGTCGCTPSSQMYSILYGFYTVNFKGKVQNTLGEPLTQFVTIWKEANVFNLVQESNERI